MEDQISEGDWVREESRVKNLSVEVWERMVEVLLVGERWRRREIRVLRSLFWDLRVAREIEYRSFSSDSFEFRSSRAIR